MGNDKALFALASGASKMKRRSAIYNLERQREAGSSEDGYRASERARRLMPSNLQNSCYCSAAVPSLSLSMRSILPLCLPPPFSFSPVYKFHCARAGGLSNKIFYYPPLRCCCCCCCNEHSARQSKEYKREREREREKKGERIP